MNTTGIIFSESDFMVYDGIIQILKKLGENEYNILLKRMDKYINKFPHPIELKKPIAAYLILFMMLNNEINICLVTSNLSNGPCCNLIGGKIEPDSRESILQCALRELKEETRSIIYSITNNIMTFYDIHLKSIENDVKISLPSRIYYGKIRHNYTTENVNEFNTKNFIPSEEYSETHSLTFIPLLEIINIISVSFSDSDWVDIDLRKETKYGNIKIAKRVIIAVWRLLVYLRRKKKI